MGKGKFWFVWNPMGRNPQYMHPSKYAAEAEAKRLASENPGHEFIVLKSVSGFVAGLPPTPPANKIDLDKYVYDNIPF